MPPSNEQLIRRQIAESFHRESQEIDRRVATLLSTTGCFEYRFTADELDVVFSNIFYTLIGVQKFVGLTVPLTYNVAAMEVQVQFPRLVVSSLLHIHSPIRAFISVHYSLKNHPALEGALALDRRSLQVEEKTARFDLIARAALATIDIEALVERELSDPAHVIRHTLPHRLRDYGFLEEIELVRLEVTPDQRLHTVLTTPDHHCEE